MRLTDLEITPFQETIDLPPVDGFRRMAASPEVRVHVRLELFMSGEQFEQLRGLDVDATVAKIAEWMTTSQTAQRR
jgi:hypothetical protein